MGSPFVIPGQAIVLYPSITDSDLAQEASHHPNRPRNRLYGHDLAKIKRKPQGWGS
jgi:hypothetical protein